jgi:acyl carrier protein
VTRRETLFAIAARIFGVPPESLSESTRRADVPTWDSVNHLRLVMEAESALGVSYPFERIPSMETIADFLGPVQEKG